MKMKMIGAYDEDSHSVFVVASFNGLVRIVILNNLFHFRVVIDGLNYGQGLFIQFLVRDRRVLQTNKERNNKTNNFEKSRLSLYRQKTNKQNNKTKQRHLRTQNCLPPGFPGLFCPELACQSHRVAELQNMSLRKSSSVMVTCDTKEKDRLSQSEWHHPNSPMRPKRACLRNIRRPVISSINKYGLIKMIVE